MSYPRFACFLAVALLFGIGCGSSPVLFMPLDDEYVPTPKQDDAQIVFSRTAIERPHRVIGVIEAQLGRDASREVLNDLLRRKAREVGADGLMLVEYGVSLDIYFTRHRTVVGEGEGEITRLERADPEIDAGQVAIGTAFVFD